MGKGGYSPISQTKKAEPKPHRLNSPACFLSPPLEIDVSDYILCGNKQMIPAHEAF